MSKQIVIGVLSVLLLSIFASIPSPDVEYSEISDTEQYPGFERFEFDPDSSQITGAHPSATLQEGEKIRATSADTHLGHFSIEGLESSLEVPEILTTIRSDVVLVIVHGEVPLWQARMDLTTLYGVEVRAHIPPSGFLLQGQPNHLALASQLEIVAAVHPLPLAFMIDSQLTDVLAEAATVTSPTTLSTAVQMNGWKETDMGIPLDHIRLGDISSDLGEVASGYLTEHRQIDSGRHLGVLNFADIPTIAADPALSWLTLQPVFSPHNNLAIGHMRADDVEHYFPLIDLNGSGHSVTVADSGIDRDHGDFNGRIQHVESVTWGDSSTEDVHSGHGTHVACTVLGNGSRGGYAGVAPQAKLRFQAMEDDDSGEFGGVSMDSLVRKAYEGNSHIHTNSWGAGSYFGEYTTSSEDADSRTNTYDQFWSYDGMIVLVSAGNDGPDSDTITPPATAKNVVAVGNHHNRYSGAPNTLADGSSRGPTDDGRIKPDVTAPGTWVRSCLSQDADDLDGASWESQWYVEYSGTSMAAPNAAGASVLIREYLMEVAGRPAPQGALIKGLLILGAEDSGSRDIPNMDEGWGRVNLVNSLIPGTDTGIWVDDRTTVRSGQTREYLFNLSRSNTPFKAVLTWSDYPGNTWSNKQLQNDLNMVVIAPDGTEYLGNDFSNGRSTTGGDADDLNNVEVALIDQADMGVWTIRISDVAHGGQRSDQAFALAVRGAGVNDLRSDPLPVASSLLLSTEIPQVNDVCEISIQIQNQGGGPANNLRVEAIAGGQNLGEVELNLGPGMTQWARWDWTPISEGQQAIIIRIDPNNDKEEIDEDNNLFETLIAVSAPGVRVTTDLTTKEIDDSGATSTSWDFVIRNTALFPTNASISSTRPIIISSGQEMTTWFTSFTQTTFELAGSESASVGFTLVHDASPEPGLYQFTVTARDDDNDIDFPLTIALRVPVLPGVAFQANFQTLMVHPTEPTSFSVDIENEGNGNQGYNIYLEPPPNWWLGLDTLGTTSSSSSGSTGAIPVDGARTVEMTFVPPNGAPLAAGLSYTANMRVISQIDPDQSWVYPIQYEVLEFESGLIEQESDIGTLRPDSTIYIQFTVTNLGNTPLTLYPNIDDRPGGWSILMGTQTLQIPVGDSVPYLLGLEGNGLAIGGDVNLYLSTTEGHQITWNGYLDVLAEPKPELNFQDTIDADGESLTEQPAGEPFTATWTLANKGAEPWLPSIELAISEQNSSSLCDPVGVVDAQETILIYCSITIPKWTTAGSHPELILNVDAEGTEVTSTTTLTIAENSAVQWRTISIDESVNGKQSNLHLEIANIGNTVISDRIIIDAPKGWTIEIQGSEVANIPIGGTQSLVLQIVPDSSGSSTLDLSLETPGVTGSTDSITIDVLANPEIDESKSSGMGTATVVAIVGLVVFVIAGLILAGILVTKLRQKPPTNAPSENAFSAQQNTAYPAMTNQATAQQLQQYQQNQVLTQNQSTIQTLQEDNKGAQ